MVPGGSHLSCSVHKLDFDRRSFDLDLTCDKGSNKLTLIELYLEIGLIS